MKGTIKRDLEFVRQAFARGDPEELIVSALAILRRYSQRDPVSYARGIVNQIRPAAANIHISQPFPFLNSR